MTPDHLSPHYPAHRYHRTKGMAVVNSPEAEEALGEGWANTPAAFQTEAPEESNHQVEQPPHFGAYDQLQGGTVIVEKRRGRPAGSKNKPADSVSE